MQGRDQDQEGAGEPGRARSARPRRFDDILVHPTQDLLRPPFMLFRGGPAWPWFWLRSDVRHCRYRLSIPLDRRPRAARHYPEDRAAAGIWCGPVTDHFGHMITDFAGRLAHSSIFRPDVPLVFSAADAPGKRPPSFFLDLLAHFRVSPDRVKIVTRPTRFDRLYVFPQAERLFGGPPDPAYLALLDRIVAAPPAPMDGSRLYVSRAGLAKGRFAGEAWLETVLARAGFEPFRPEMHSLEEQMRRYRRAEHLLFAEGSAVHALQLLGSAPGRVTVLCRRPGHRIAAAALIARAPMVDYIDCLAGLVHGAHPNGWAQHSSGMSVLDERRCVAAFAAAGIDIGVFWDASAYVEARDRDLLDWIDLRRSRPRPPREIPMIRKTLARAGVSLPV
jgi:hypothetical protein